MWLLARVAATAGAAPINPWGAATGPGESVIAPFLYLYPDAIETYTYASAGFAGRGSRARFDVWAGGGAAIPLRAADGAGAASLELFPRVFVHPALGFAAHLYWQPGQDGIILAPELHLAPAWDRFAVTANVSWQPVISRFEGGNTLVAQVAPEVWLNDALSLFVEADPTFDLAWDGAGAWPGPELLVVPGFSLSLDPEAHHAVALGVQVPVWPPPDGDGAASLALTYAFAFGG